MSWKGGWEDQDIYQSLLIKGGDGDPVPSGANSVHGDQRVL